MGTWLVARNGDNYCAVHREGTRYWYDGVDQEFPYSTSHGGRQTWAVMVGNKDTHNSFDDFKQVVRGAKVKESHRWNWSEGRWEYRSSVKIDGKEISNTGYSKKLPIKQLSSTFQALATE